MSTTVASGQQRAIAAANQELLTTYWAIGADILARQDEQGWGAKIIDRLCADLRERFPAPAVTRRGTSVHACLRGRLADPAIVQGSLARLPWYRQIALLEKLPGPDLRLWYAQAAVANVDEVADIASRPAAIPWVL